MPTGIAIGFCIMAFALLWEVVCGTVSDYTKNSAIWWDWGLLGTLIIFVIGFFVVFISAVL